MNEEQIKQRFEDLEAALEEYKKQNDALREDLKIVITFSHPNLVTQAREYARPRDFKSPFGNPPADDLNIREACDKFAEKYASLEPDL